MKYTTCCPTVKIGSPRRFRHVSVIPADTVSSVSYLAVDEKKCDFTFCGDVFRHGGMDGEFSILSACPYCG